MLFRPDLRLLWRHYEHPRIGSIAQSCPNKRKTQSLTQRIAIRCSQLFSVAKLIGFLDKVGTISAESWRLSRHRLTIPKRLHIHVFIVQCLRRRIPVMAIEAAIRLAVLINTGFSLLLPPPPPPPLPPPPSPPHQDSRRFFQDASKIVLVENKILCLLVLSVSRLFEILPKWSASLSSVFTMFIRPEDVPS